MTDIIVKEDCCFGGFVYTTNVTQCMDENDHEMVILVDSEEITTQSNVRYFSTFTENHKYGFTVIKYTTDGSYHMVLTYSYIPDGRKLLNGYCMINNKPYDVKEYTIEKDLNVDGKTYDYCAVCRITTPILYNQK